MNRFALVLLSIVGLSSFALRANEQDDRIKRLEDLVKAQASKIDALEKKDSARVGEIKMDAAVQKAIDNAVARAGTGAKYGGAFLAPDQPDIKGIGLYFTGEYMYTKVQKGDTVFAYHNAPNSIPIGFFGPGGGGIGAGEAKNTELDWSHGFRIGLGYRLPYDGWDLNVNYQRLDADSDKSARVDASTGTNFLYTPEFLLPVDLAKAHQEFEFNKVNLELGRRMKMTNTLSVRVFGGPSIVWFNDDQKFNYWNNTPGLFILLPFNGVGQGIEVRRKTDDTLYGIRAGADGDFKLGHNVSLYGKAAGSLLTGEQEHNTFRGIDANGNGTFAATEIIQDTHTSFHQVVTAVEVAAGVAWDHKINENFNLKVSLGYEFANYFNVIERTDALIILRGNREKSDLGMHGLVFKVKLDF